MKYYECDWCKKKIIEDKMVTLKGAVGLSGGILLPERLQEKHFCDPKCFWEWIHKYDVEKIGYQTPNRELPKPPNSPPKRIISEDLSFGKKGD
jgi:hypothetical protein